MIKAKPRYIDSNCKYMDLFKNSRNEGIDNQHLLQLIGISEFMLNLTYQNLNGVTKEEFEVKSEKNEININDNLSKKKEFNMEM